METETISMLTWAFEYPYLYTLINLKPAIVAVAVAAIAKTTVSILFRYALKK